MLIINLKNALKKLPVNQISYIDETFKIALNFMKQNNLSNLLMVRFQKSLF